MSTLAADVILSGDQPCLVAEALADRPTFERRIAFIGQPNTGKSTFFNRVTKSRAGVANWPGLTVDLQRALIDLDGQRTEFVDLPGIYDLNGFTEDEHVVQRFLSENAVNLIVLVINATQIDRQIRIALQIKALGLPAVVALNMADEASRYGVDIDIGELRKRLGMLVYPISAKYGSGCDTAVSGISAAVRAQEQSLRVTDLSECLGRDPIDEHRVAAELDGILTMPPLASINLTSRIDAVMLHPVFGIPLFFATMLIAFMVVWYIGLPLQDPTGDAVTWLGDHVLGPLVAPLPAFARELLLNGIWAGISLLSTFVPLVAVFIIVMAILEDSGYLSRAAYLMDALMRRLGLDGRAFVLQIMGFGCNVPSIMGTRVIRSRAARLTAMLVIPFSLCSARLQVFVFILAAVMTGIYGAIALFILYLLSFAVSFIIAAVMSYSGALKDTEPFVLELPPYRLPTVKQVVTKLISEMREFLGRLMVFMVVGSVLMWLLTKFPAGASGMDTYAGQLGRFFEPVMQPLGINALMTVSLIFGFVAKEIQLAALAIAYGMSDHALHLKLSQTLSFGQAFSFCLFSLLYTPCLTTLATIKAEARTWRFTLFSLALSLAVAWIASFLFYQGWRLVTGGV
ncbi:ferrous iron transport protein B [Halochromatium sp.]